MKAKKQLLPTVCLVLILLALLLYLLLTLGKLSFFPGNTVEDYYDDVMIKAGRYRFYCATDDTQSVIGEVKAAKRYLFLWKAVEPDSAKTIKVGATGEVAGTLLCYKVGDTYHYFIDWAPQGQEAGIDLYTYRTDTITFNGKPVTLEKLSYFTADEPESAMTIGGIAAWTVEEFQKK